MKGEFSNVCGNEPPLETDGDLRLAASRANCDEMAARNAELVRQLAEEREENTQLRRHLDRRAIGNDPLTQLLRERAEAAESQLAALSADIKEPYTARFALDGYSNHACDWVTRGDYDRIALALAAERKDAQRYRWLREQHWSKSPLAVVSNPKVAVRLGHDFPSLDRLDAMVDAALTALRAEGGEKEK